VRFLVGTMIDVALGRRPASDVDTLLGASDNAFRCGHCAADSSDWSGGVQRDGQHCRSKLDCVQ